MIHPCHFKLFYRIVRSHQILGSVKNVTVSVMILLSLISVRICIQGRFQMLEFPAVEFRIYAPHEISNVDLTVFDWPLSKLCNDLNLLSCEKKCGFRFFNPTMIW